MENVLIISPRVDRTNSLLEAFRGLPFNAISVTTLGEAREMLFALAFDIVISEENLEDGAYRDVLSFVQSNSKNARFFVILPREAQERFIDAIRLGVTDAIPFPFESLDLDKILNRAMNQSPTDKAFRAGT